MTSATFRDGCSIQRRMLAERVLPHSGSESQARFDRLGDV